jgi:preprotein translocase subunit SecE
MAKTEAVSFWNELLTIGLYKRSQGRLARQLTAAALMVLVIAGAYILSEGPLASYATPTKAGIPTAICLVAAWLIYRAVNYPAVAEFLISVEGEMSKVSWASRTEVYRATVVVLSSMFFLAAVLYAYDFFWLEFLSWIGVIQS